MSQGDVLLVLDAFDTGAQQASVRAVQVNLESYGLEVHSVADCLFDHPSGLLLVHLRTQSKNQPIPLPTYTSSHDLD